MQTSNHVGSSAVERSLVRALRGRSGRLTRADAEVLTGLPEAQVEDGLHHLLTEYRSHLAATESGELLYSFDPALERRGAEPLAARARRLAVLAWRGFAVAFKVAIVVVLVAYVAIFVALLLGLMLARLSGQGNDRDSDDGGVFPLGLLWWLLPWDLGPYSTAPGGLGPRRRRSRPHGKKVHQQVFDFVFGPPCARPAPDEPDREALAYIRAHAGRVTAAELVVLQDLDLPRAEEEATRLMCNYGGEPEVTDGGVVVYVFRELRRTADASPGASLGVVWSHAWERLEPRPALTGNSTTADVVITVMNGFTLLAPLVFVVPALRALGIASHAALVWLRVVPFIFSWTFFAIPLGRVVARAARERARLRRNRHRLVLREVFVASAAGQPLDPARVTAALAGSDADEATALRRELDALVGPLAGDIVLEPADERQLGWLVFPRLIGELAAAAHARVLAPPEEADVGEVVFDSAAPPPPGGSAVLREPHRRARGP
jgi:hypothetical protein